MAQIGILDQNTIDKIAAGEVIERPASVVKELLENAIDARATAVTVEIRDGGLSLIRVTDNGCGIPKEEVAMAFFRHATSKIKSVEDLFTVSSLGFRGEALSSIAAVSQVEVITKTPEELCAVRYQIEGGEEKRLEEIGAPEGTTFLVRNLFYNTPARKKFLKTAQTEGAHVEALVEKIAMSHPDISVRFIQNHQNKLHTSGNHNLKDLIYTVFGREMAANLLPVTCEGELLRVQGFAGKPVIARSSRNFENYYINGRYVKSSLVTRAIEEAYRPFMMQRRYPFVLLHLTIEPEYLDVNVHPAKMELRFREGERIYELLYGALRDALAHKELIPQMDFGLDGESKKEAAKEGRTARPEPFEVKRKSRYEQERREGEAALCAGRPEAGAREVGGSAGESEACVREAGVSAGRPEACVREAGVSAGGSEACVRESNASAGGADVCVRESNACTGGSEACAGEPETWVPGQPREVLAEGKPLYGMGEGRNKAEGRPGLPAAGSREPLPGPGRRKEPDGQLDLFEEKFLSPESRHRHRIIGQLFDTYWLVEFDDHLYILDQHAAHEKVLYERLMADIKKREHTSQMVNPPVILTLGSEEQALFEKYRSYFVEIGFEIEPFGGKEYAVRGVPDNLLSVAKKELLTQLLDSLSEDVFRGNPDIIYERVASMSCKAAVKGKSRLSSVEAERLIDQLFELENPYTCPHGRPTMISMSRYELEKKFKRII